MTDFSGPIGPIVFIMILNGLLVLPFGVLAARSFRRKGRLSPLLAFWSGAAMHGHALMTFAIAWFDKGSLFSPNVLSVVFGLSVLLLGAFIIYLGRRAYGDQARVYGLKEDALITQGIYRMSRNPQYLGYGLMFIGAAIATGSMLCFIFIALFCLAIHVGITRIEEPHLMRIFGADYAEYKQISGRYFRIVRSA